MTTLRKINGIKIRICKHKETEKNRAGSNGLLKAQGLCLHQMFSTANSIEEGASPPSQIAGATQYSSTGEK